jgi:aspartyl-tRNA(Asn)/glutamyl-tRNA(Gln) amidotransferase subunit A
MSLHTQTIAQLKAQLDAKAVSSVELSQHYLKRIDALNPTLNAFITVDANKTLAEAKAADAARAQGSTAPLLGLPIAQKDIFLIDTWRTTCGSKMLSNFVAPYTATVVANMQAAGVVTLGKLNMDEFAMGSSNETSFFGNVRNPWALDRVPGGSSGGSAASTAAGLSPGVTGTDTGGSIRQPAMFCNLVGLKPTYGICSRYGIIAFASSLDQAGPMARTAEDCALLLNAMAGYDPRDATSLNRPREDYTRSLNTPIKGLRIGLPNEFWGEGTAPDVQAAAEQAVKQLEAMGAIVKRIALPNVKYSVPAYYVIAPAEASSNLSRFDGVRYGHRTQTAGDLTDLYKKSRAEGFGAEVKRRILIGTYVLSHGYYDAYYLQAQKLRRLIANDFANAYKEVDVIVGPTAPETAFKFGDKADDPLKMYLNDIFTIAANLTGQPALSVPCGFDREGMSIGLQIVGDYLDEARMLGIAHQYQQATAWHTRLSPVMEQSV